MTDADFYQSHKDDPNEWGEAEGTRGRKPARERLNAIISVRLTPEEEEALKAVARERGLTLSAFVRAAALREATPAVRSQWPGNSSHTQIAKFDAVWEFDAHVLTGTGLTDVKAG